MREDLLHFIWKYKKIQLEGLNTTKGEKLLIESVGEHNHNSGPDFFNSKIRVGEQLWAGNVEIHIKASDWYVHNHEQDKNYDNVILHIVWENDITVFRIDGSEIPTLELKNVISKSVLESYKNLFNVKSNSFINCEKDISVIDEFLFSNWLDRLYIERLERKSTTVLKMLKESNNNWEQVLFTMLMKNFGSIVNGESFLTIANAIDYDIFKKNCNNALKTESILYGMAGLLDEEKVKDSYYIGLKNEFSFLKNKYSLENDRVEKVAFFRLRPSNFPTIRLSQISSLYIKHQTLFSKLMQTKSLNDIYDIFNVKASNYWDNHYTFGKISKDSSKKLTKSFINLIVINTIIPLRFCYSQHLGKDEISIIIDIVSSLQQEKNSIVDNFKNVKVSINTAKDSQAIVQLYNEYCSKNKCLQCVVGNSLLNRNT